MQIVSPRASHTYDIYVNDVVEYKLKGKLFYKKDIILNMDSTRMLLQNDSIVKISDIKAFRVHRKSHLLKTLTGFFFIGGVGYVGLNVINNGILENRFGVDEKALYIGGGFVAAGIILKLIRVKHIRIHKKTIIKMVEQNFQKLN